MEIVRCFILDYCCYCGIELSGALRSAMRRMKNSKIYYYSSVSQSLSQWVSRPTVLPGYACAASCMFVWGLMCIDVTYIFAATLGVSGWVRRQKTESGHEQCRKESELSWASAYGVEGTIFKGELSISCLNMSSFMLKKMRERTSKWDANVCFLITLGPDQEITRFSYITFVCLTNRIH